MTFNSEKKYYIPKEIISSEVDKNFYLLNMNTGKYIKLNSSAKFIFKKIEQGMNQPDIIDAIVNVFGESEAKAKADYLDFLSKGISLKIIKML